MSDPSPVRDADRRRSRGPEAGLVLLLVAAAWARIAPFRGVIPAGELLPPDGDCFYHLRRIESALRGALVRFDPLMNWPSGGIAPWTDGFDLLGAAFAAIASGGSGPAGAKLAAFFWPVALGLLGVWGVVELARRLVPASDRWTPLAAGVAMAFVPRIVRQSSFGNLDHHVAETLTVVALAAWSLRVFPSEGEEAPGWAWEATGAFLVAMALWVFPGGVQYVALAAVPLGLAALGPARPRTGTRGGAGTGAPALVAGAVAGLVLSVPMLRVHGRLVSFVMPSVLQPLLVGTAGVALAAAVLAGRRMDGPSPGRRAAVALAAAAAVFVAVLAGTPAVAAEIGEALHGWLLRQDPWIASIGEFQPLLRTSRGLGLAVARSALGSLAVTGVLAVPVAVAVAWRYSQPRAASYALLAVAAAALALLQVRFTTVAAPFLAVNVALALRGVALLAARLLPPARWVDAIPLAGALAFVLASPSIRFQLQVRGRQEILSLDEASEALALRRPPVHGRRDGIFAPWDVGHAVMYGSGRPVVANGFGTYLERSSFEEVQQALRGDERRLVETMERRDLGFLLGGGLVLGNHLTVPIGVAPVMGDPPELNPNHVREQPLSQLLIAGSGLPGAGVPHLERLMPIFASQAVARGITSPLPVVWAYELVAGATLAGRADPGTTVVGELAFRERGRDHRYRAWTVASGDGRWRMRVATPSGMDTGTIRTGGAWFVRAGAGARIEVEVPEAAVREGREIAVP